MAITISAFVPKFRQNGGGVSMSGTFSPAPNAGDLIVVPGWAWQTPGWADGDATDNQSNDYDVAIISDANGQNKVAIFYTVCGSVSGSFIVTLNPSGLGNFFGVGGAVAITPASSWNQASCLDVTAKNTQNGQGASPNPVLSGTTASATHNNGVVVAAFAGDQTQASSPAVETVSPAWTEIAEEKDFSSYVPGECDVKIITAGGAQSCSWLLSNNCNLTAAIAVFKQTTDTGTGGGGKPTSYYDMQRRAA